MIQLLYIGNRLRQGRANVSAIDALGPLLENEGYGVYYASTKNNKLVRMFDMLMAVIRYGHKVDVVLIDTYSTLNFYYALSVSQICRMLNIPYIPILHGGHLERRLKHNPKMSQLVFGHSRANVAPSGYIKTVFERYGYKELKFIPNAIQIDRYPILQKEYTDIRLLWVRSFSEIYNPCMAVRVLKTLRDQGFLARLCMVGPDSDGSLKKVKMLADALEVEVEFTGKLSKQEWIQLSEQYNFFINTTTVDNMPVSVMEAMALGFPVISTDVGGMPYLIENKENGLLVPNNAVDAMAKAVTMLYGDEVLRNKIINGARKKAEQLDWGMVKQAWHDVLKGL